MNESKGDRTPHYIYVLRCSDLSLYIGATDDVASRVLKHNEGSASRYTSLRRPVHSIYTEEYATRHEAFSRESQVKRWARAKKEALVAGDLDRLKRL